LITTVVAGSDRFNEHDVVARRVEDCDDVSGGGSETAQGTPRRHAADEHPGVGGEILHADAVAEDRPVRERAGGVNGDDTQLSAQFAVFTRQGAGQCALAGPGGTGNTDDMRIPALWIEVFECG
jgi:hypothetical protein